MLKRHDHVREQCVCNAEYAIDEIVTYANVQPPAILNHVIIISSQISRIGLNLPVIISCRTRYFSLPILAFDAYTMTNVLFDRVLYFVLSITHYGRAYLDTVLRHCPMMNRTLFLQFESRTCLQLTVVNLVPTATGDDQCVATSSLTTEVGTAELISDAPKRKR